MQSAPINRAAATVFSRCCATNVSTVGTPVMSMIAMAAPLLTIASSRFCITTCVRSLSSVPIKGSARIPSQRRTTGVEISSNSCCWRRMISSRPFRNELAVSRPSRSISRVARHSRPPTPAHRCPIPSGCAQTTVVSKKRRTWLFRRVYIPLQPAAATSWSETGGRHSIPRVKSL
jgi:hypothetical protein